MFLSPSSFLNWKSGRSLEYCCCTLELHKKQYKIEINKKAIGKVFQRNSSIDFLCHNPLSTSFYILLWKLKESSPPKESEG